MPDSAALTTLGAPAPPPTAFAGKALRGKKKAFADSFLLNYSMIEAAKAAGAPPGRERDVANRMLESPDVALYITASIAHTESTIRPTQLRVLDEIAALAFGDAGKALEFDKDGKITGVRLDKVDGRTIQQFSVHQHQHGTNVTAKFQPKVEMLKMLGQTNGLINDDGAPPRKVTIVFNGPTQINAGKAP